MNPSQPQAKAIAIKGDRIVKVGTNDEINLLVGKDTKVIRLKGKTVVPGFIDTHVHIADFAMLLTWIDLTHVSSIEEVQNNLRNRITKILKGKWVVGRGWDKTCFVENRLLTRYDLDLVAPDNPVILYHRCEQMCVVNSKGLEIAGVTKNSVPPPEGVIDKDAKTGEITGILRGNATNLLWKLVPEASGDELVEAVGLAFEKIVEAGITSVHWMVRSSQELSIVRGLHAKNKAKLRINVIVPVELLDEIADFKLDNDSAFRVGGAEISVDGYLASRTAALCEPYSDAPSERGTLLCTKDELTGLATKILNAGLQLVIHAVGDKAVDAALTTIEAVGVGFRNRIEQAAVLNEQLVERLEKKGVIVSVQPCVIASEFSVWSANEHLGNKRAKWFFPLNTLLRKGVHIAGGSDCPMEPVNPLLGMQKAVTREVFSEQRISAKEALCMYTVDAAYSSCEENVKGTIEAGKLADLAVLSDDPLTLEPVQISKVAVEMSIVGGNVAFSKANAFPIDSS
jgi:predicted amidohydrolase YtcJ